ncbi:MAG: hypothetical protein ACRD1D_04010 [Acidimicrobiales bacterium]
MGSQRVSGRARTTVAVLLCGACTFFGIGVVTAARVQMGIAWGDSVSPAKAERAAASTFTVPVSPDQWFRPGGRNAGTEHLVEYLAKLALHDNAPLYVSDWWGRTSGGTNSDHHVSRSDSWALDVAVLGIQHPTPATEKAAQRIASALGEPNWAGGDLTRVVNGYRFQVLWKVAGHFNHVHVGVRKVA